MLYDEDIKNPSIPENGKLENKQNKDAPLKNENILFIADETSAKTKK